MVGVILFLAGVILGWFVASVVLSVNTVGTIRFYTIDPSEPPAMTAILDESPDDICKCKRVVFKISHE